MPLEGVGKAGRANPGPCIEKDLKYARKYKYMYIHMYVETKYLRVSLIYQPFKTLKFIFFH